MRVTPSKERRASRVHRSQWEPAKGGKGPRRVQVCGGCLLTSTPLTFCPNFNSYEEESCGAERIIHPPGDKKHQCQLDRSAVLVK